MLLSIIIPALNEEKVIGNLLQQLQCYRKLKHEIIVVDGGSSDKTIAISEPLCDKIITGAHGRAKQMNLGVSQSSNDILWFLHADTLITDNAVENIQNVLKKHHWGRFNIKLSGKNKLFRIIENMMNLRSCISGIATGDQGIFVKKIIFEKVNGYPHIPLMEDIALSKKLKKISKPVCLKEIVVTSSRRWQEKGILTTVVLMWRLRFLYWIGMNVNKIALKYK